ncbi:heavy-metal-associated domain-containing protein [Pseudoflavitalea sp. X16]|uniref:heavy-metal-associated domain-containing protein n=1 Tax=Paraflavitalea devenefica TaxID=2716334 RepID=UPI0014234C47|nr:heavy-metal-associated domain-containing protein [Paraflavitalea devenefica]NII25709.1 heavy-metal-associated domain-containing protein [Paraflavitalea devenefica]
MKTIQFKTNIKCSGCIAKVSPELNKTVGRDNWKVNLESSDKVLTVSDEEVSETDIQEALAKVGYKAEKIG